MKTLRSIADVTLRIHKKFPMFERSITRYWMWSGGLEEIQETKEGTELEITVKFPEEKYFRLIEPYVIGRNSVKRNF